MTNRPAVLGCALLGGWLVTGAISACARESAEAPGPPPAAPVAKTDQATVGDYSFEVRDGTLSYRGRGAEGELAVGASPPCRLHRDRAGAVRTLETASSTVFLVECAAAHPDSATLARPLCRTTIRGIVIDSKGVRLAIRSQQVGMCPPFEWDRQMFQYFLE